MPKIVIIIKKYLYTRPKWRILRIFTKVVKRSQLEKVARSLENDIGASTDAEGTAFLRGQLSVIKYFLDQ